MPNDDNAGGKTTSALKHDIKNQLSNISLSLEQLRYEIPDPTDDHQYYLDTIFNSCKKINELLDDM